MMRLTLLTIATVLWIFTTAATSALAAPGDGPPAESVIRIGGNNEFPPYEFVNTDGRPDGYNIDLIKAVAGLIDLPIEIKLERWADARQALEDGRIDALTGVIYSPQRDRVFDFAVPHVVVSYALFVREDSRITAPEDVRGRQVIVVKDVYAHDWLRRNEFTDQVITVDYPEEALRLLTEGRHDCAVLIRLHGLDLIRQQGITNIKTVGPPVLTQKMSFAVRSGNADLLAQFNEGLYQLQRSGAYDDIYRRWFSVYEERVARHRVMTVAKWILFPLLILLVAAALWIWSLNRSVARQTEALRSNRQKLAQILEHLPIALLVVDDKGQVTHWNQECLHLTGIPAPEAIGRKPAPAASAISFSTFLALLTEKCERDDPAAAISNRAHICNPLEGIFESEVLVPWLGPDGKWLYGTITPFADDQGRRIGSIEAWQDLTDRKVLERQLAQAQKMEAMGTLAGSVAHDFASYLQAIGGYAGTAQLEPDLSANVRSSLGGIQETIVKARELIRQIMLFSRQDLVAPSPVDIAPIIERTLQIVGATAAETIVFESDIRSRARIMSDETQVSQVLLNLCTNAVQAMTAEGGRLTVRVEDVELQDERGFNGRGRVSGSFLKLTVADTGCGIPPDQIEKIFEPFYTRRQDKGGNGMGLAIVHGIVRGYGGKISVHSQAGQGAVFEVLWPIGSTGEKAS
ncbi:MAG: transporter substrate-binding domain-containing protein [Desulfobacterales bacterium]|jgi:two-component system sensor histidine kinase EvgS